MAQQAWRARFTGCALALAALLAPRAAAACSCAGGPLASVSWPLDGATDVATDTPIVIWRYRYTDGLPPLPVLQQEGGASVALNETARLTSPGDVCGPSEYVFLRPASALTPFAHYGLRFDSTLLAGWPGAAVGFSVGHGSFAPEAPASPDIRLMAVYPTPDCTQPDCRHLSELRVDLGALPARMLWLDLQSAATELAGAGWIFLPKGNPGANSAVQMPVALSPGDGCIDIRILGVEGRALFSERRCQPNRCAVYTGSGVSTCGGPPFTGVDVARLAADSCEHPPLLWTGDAGIVYPAPGAQAPATPDAGTATDAPTKLSAVAAAGGPGSAPADAMGGTGSRPVTPQPHGCSSAHVGSQPSAAGTLMLLLAVLGCRRRRAARGAQKTSGGELGRECGSTRSRSCTNAAAER